MISISLIDHLSFISLRILDYNGLSQVSCVLQLSCLCDRVTAVQEAYRESRQAEVRTRYQSRNKETDSETKTQENTTPAANKRHKIQRETMNWQQNREETDLNTQQETRAKDYKTRAI